LPVLPGVLAIALMASLPMLRAFLVLTGSILAASTTLLAGLRQRICMYAYTVNAQMHLFCLPKCTDAFEALWAEGLRIFTGEKNPLAGGLFL
jgi:hypothetical protein